MKKVLFIIISLSLPSQVLSQTSFLPEAMIAEPGETKTNNYSTGTSANLRLGTSSSFGTNANVNSSEGFTIDAKSTLKTLTGTFVSKFGDKDDGKISADVTNVRSEGPGTHTSDNLTVNADTSLAAEGKAEITGVYSEINIELDPEVTTAETTIDDNEGHVSTSIETSSGGAGQNMNNSLTVDITNNNFNNAFSQAF